MRPINDTVQRYLGDGTLTDYEFDFKITSLSQLEIVIYDTDDEEIYRFRGDEDHDLIEEISFDEQDGGGTVVLVDELTSGHTMLLIFADDEPAQTDSYKNKFDFTLKRIENSFDKIVGMIQRASYLARRSLRLNDFDELADFDGQLPTNLADYAGGVIALNLDADGIRVGPTVEEIETWKNEAEAAADAAQASQLAAAASEQAAAASEAAAETAATNAAASATAASASEVAAELAESNAAASEQAASASETAAAASETAAAQSATDAEAAKVDAEAAADLAVTTAAGISSIAQEVADAQQAVTDAEAARDAALAAQTAAETAETNAETAETNAETAQAAAEAAQAAAETAQAAAETAETNAETAETGAVAAQTAAEAAQTAAETAQTAAESAQTAAESARDDAEAARDQAVVGIQRYSAYADDAAYVTAKGSAAADGDTYYNTTIDKAKVYANGAWVEVGSGAGGGGALKWLESMASALPTIESNVESYLFEPDAVDQAVYGLFRVPQGYTAGGQIRLRTTAYSPDTTGTMLLQSVSTLIRTGTDAISSTTNQRTSTNAAINLATAALANKPYAVTLDLTDSSGQINGVAVSPGDLIKIALQRGTDTMSSDLRAVVHGSELTFS